MAKPNLQSFIKKEPIEIKKKQGTTNQPDTKQTIFHMPAAAKKQFDILAAELETTKQALMAEAMNDLFLKYKKPPIA